jgi:hypothetical protein
VRVVFAKHTTTSLGFAAARGIDLSLRVPAREAVRVLFKDVSGPGALKTGRLHVPVSETWSEVFFGLEGPTDDRVRIEVHHPDGVEKVTSATPEAWFSVVGTSGGGSSATGKTSKPPSRPPPAIELVVPSPATSTTSTTSTTSRRSDSGSGDWDSWADSIADEGIRKVFLHIQKHGVITDLEVTNFLGSQRAMRRFSLELEQHLPKLPFRVRIEAADGGKRYVREGDQ